MLHKRPFNDTVKSNIVFTLHNYTVDTQKSRDS